MRRSDSGALTIHATATCTVRLATDSAALVATGRFGRYTGEELATLLTLRSDSSSSGARYILGSMRPSMDRPAASDEAPDDRESLYVEAAATGAVDGMEALDRESLESVRLSRLNVDGHTRESLL